MGEESCTTTLTEAKKAAEAGQLPGSAPEASRANLDGADGWNERQGQVLDEIPVTLIGGGYFEHAGGIPEVWPNDDFVALSSALATGASDRVLPHRACVTRPDVHSIFFADALGLPWSVGLTWDPVVLDAVNAAVADADTALDAANRSGCP